MAGEYRGLLGAFRAAFGRSDSSLLRAYVVTAVLVGAFVGALLLLGLVSWLATPAPLGQRALLGVIVILFFLPLFAPVLVVARRHRRGGTTRRADAVLGLAGFGFVAAVYLGLLIWDPNPHDVTGPLAPAIDWVDALPGRYWVVPPLASVAGLGLAIRLTRRPSGGDGAPGTGPDP